VRLFISNLCAAVLLLLPAEGLTREVSGIAGGGRVSLDLRDLDLRSALNLIAEQHGFNVVCGDEVQGEVTGHFVDVPLEEVLDALLRACGYEYEWVGNVIVVNRADEGSPRWSETRVIELRHADGTEVRRAVEKLLSPRGSIQLFPEKQEEEATGAEGDGSQPRVLILHDERARVEDIASVVKELDRAPRQLMIEVRLVETVLSNDLDLGFDWNAEGSIEGNAVPQDLPLDRDRFRFGTLSLEQFQVVLRTLDEDGRSELISNPRIAAEDNRMATISVGTIFPVRTVSRFSEAGITQDLLTYEDKEINIQLSVTPHVTGDSLITMVVNPVVEDIIGWTGEHDDQPITSKRELTTRVTVRYGETIAMGGLIKNSEIETIRRVWLLGRIPILGRLLFSNTVRMKESTDMLVFITPHILEE